MNNRLSKLLLFLAAVLSGLPPLAAAPASAQTLDPASKEAWLQAKSYAQLTRSDGATVLGLRKDASHFVTCTKVEIPIGVGDKVIHTDKTCEEETGNPHCLLCVMYQDERLRTQGPAPAEEKWKGVDTAATADTAAVPSASAPESQPVPASAANADSQKKNKKAGGKAKPQQEQKPAKKDSTVPPA